jgi:DNA-binding XRE family transcriptional regulator
LKQHRKALDLTQQDVADQVGWSAITIRKIEAGDYGPSKQVAERMADVLARTYQLSNLCSPGSRASTFSAGRFDSLNPCS